AANDLGQLAVLLAPLEDLHDRELQAFGVDITGGAAQHAANVLPVGHGGGEGDDLPLPEDRQGEDHVVQVAAHDVGVVGEQHVAGLDPIGTVKRQLRLDGV